MEFDPFGVGPSYCLLNCSRHVTNTKWKITKLINGTSVSYAYNDSDRVIALYNTQTIQRDISFFTYVHDRAGNRQTVTGSWGTQTYAYDNIVLTTRSRN